jgi:hypothetical protein
METIQTPNKRELLEIRKAMEQNHRYSELSKQLKINIKTENQYQLALMGAPKELVEKNEVDWVFYNIDRQHLFDKRQKPYKIMSDNMSKNTPKPVGDV